MSQVVSVELPDHTYQRLAATAARHGCTTEEAARQWIERAAEKDSEELAVRARAGDRRAFLKLSREDQDRILAEQAERLIGFYECDPAWREWDSAPLTDDEDD